MRKIGKKFENICETNFDLENKLQDLIHEDQIMKKIIIKMLTVKFLV